jgi:hypothetical protein
MTSRLIVPVEVRDETAREQYGPTLRIPGLLAADGPPVDGTVALIDVRKPALIVAHTAVQPRFELGTSSPPACATSHATPLPMREPA